MTQLQRRRGVPTPSSGLRQPVLSNTKPPSYVYVCVVHNLCFIRFVLLLKLT